VNEFLGKCLEIAKAKNDSIHIVKGRPYHPQSQGKVERGHAPFKEGLQKRMTKHGPNRMLGCYVMNYEINQHVQWDRDNLSPYNMMHGKTGSLHTNVVFGEVAATLAKTEYGVLCAKFLCTQARKLDSLRIESKAELQHIMKKGNFLLCSIELFLFFP
jgi:hypothetical protein